MVDVDHGRRLRGSESPLRQPLGVLLRLERDPQQRFEVGGAGELVLNLVLSRLALEDLAVDRDDLLAGEHLVAPLTAFDHHERGH